MRRFIFRRRHEQGYVYALRRTWNVTADLCILFAPYAFGIAMGVLIAFLIYLGVASDEEAYRNNRGGGEIKSLRPESSGSVRTGADTGRNLGRENLGDPRIVQGDRSGPRSAVEDIHATQENEGAEVVGYDMDLGCVALNIYHEARHEPTKGKLAVALVIMNRATQRNMSMCEVVFERKQFSWASNALDEHGKLLPEYLPTDNPYWTEAKRIASEVMYSRVSDFTHGATFYHTDYIRKPRWAYRMRPAGKWGHHLFYIKPESFYVPIHKRKAHETA